MLQQPGAANFAVSPELKAFEGEEPSFVEIHNWRIRMKKIVIIILAVLAGISAYGKDRTITGVVTGMDAEGNPTPLIKATVQVVGTRSGAFTDKSGRFEVNAPFGACRLSVSYAGYNKDTVPVPAGTDYADINLTPISTEEVKVYGRQPDQVISESSIFKEETITERGLQKAACCNLSESFQANPSVDVSFSDALTGAKQIQLLGLGGAYSQFLMEKIPAMRGIAANFGLSYVPGPWMESIQISKGAASVSTGYESITGQINVELKKPELSEPFLMNLYGDNMGGLETSINGVYKINNKLSTMLMLHGNTDKKEIDNNGDSFMDHAMADQVNIFNRWKYDGDVWKSISGVMALYEDRMGGQAEYFKKKDSSLYGIDIKTRKYEFFTKNGFIFPGEIFSSLGTMVAVTHHKQESEYGLRNFDAEQNSAYVNILYQSGLDKPHSAKERDDHPERTDLGTNHNYVIGMNMQYDNYIENFADSLMRRYEMVPGAFAEYTYSGINSLVVTAGLRVDNHNKYGTFYTPRLHLKWAVTPDNTIRASVGKGTRTTDIYAENTQLFNSSRKFIVEEALRPEEAWNYGINSHHELFLFDMFTTVNLEYYRTNFDNQVIVDLDKNVNEVHFYNLRGKSYSNSFQADITGEPIYGLTFMLAYRLNDVKATYSGKLEDKPLVSRHKGFLNLAYTTPENTWSFDATLDINGGGRLPDTRQNPEQYRLGTTYPAYALVHGQVTKRFRNFELYLGAENIGDYKQPHPILASDKPYSPWFDSSIIWGPVAGRKIYIGTRLRITK